MTTTSHKPLRIIALTAENVKRLSAVHIEPKGNVVQITGKNRNGKTSVLDSIWWAIEGASHIQKSPIRTGQAKARIRLDLGEMIVTRRFAAKEDGGYTTSISVESPDGAVFKSPQKLLDDLVGELSFDPLAFAQMKPKEQFDALRKFVTEVDIEELDNLNRGDFTRRTDVNREFERARAAAAAIAVAPDAPAERVDEEDLVAKIQEAGDHNATIERRRANRQAAESSMRAARERAQTKLDDIETQKAAIQQQLDADTTDINQQIEALNRQIEVLKARLESVGENAVAKMASIREERQREAAAATAEADAIQARLDAAEPLPQPIDTAALAQQLNAARDSNRALDAWEQDRKRKTDHERQAEQLRATADELTARIAERTQQKQAAIAKAHLPIDGLGFGDGFITLNGQPFEQASDAEQWEASIAIAAALNPRLRVIRVRQGSLLDEDAMKRLEEVAERLDFQVWIERVDGSGTVGFVLEDGHLKAMESEPKLSTVANPTADAANEAADSVGGAA
ncbi:MAG TPA: hypothetical protein VGD45_20345 [Steroidobacter sp.]|uniref:ATP-binding protein n=1 Tax=Steroidobacter sp. TaxID=1978227 RepID=UPI002ED840C1